MKAFTFKLSNKIRIIHQEIKSDVSYCGIMINSGSRDELENELGLSHFIEHNLFKGTSKRNAFYVVNRLEEIGGEIDAYTAKEETFIYATFLKDYYDRTIEILSDMVFNSTFPKKEIEKEKIVIEDEINSYKDSPSEMIFDEFENAVFKNHPLGQNILGNENLIKNFNKATISNFIRKNYNTNEIILSSVGNISPKKIVEISKKYLGKVPINKRNHFRLKKYKYIPKKITLKKNILQNHCIIGNIAPNIFNKNNLTFNLLNNILGGPNINSRLNLLVREKFGFTYNIESFFNSYSDYGIWGIYFTSESKYLNKILNLIKRELIKMKKIKLGPKQINTARNQLYGQLAIFNENKSNVMQSNAKNMILNNRVETLEQIKYKISKISADEIQCLAQEVFDINKLTTIIIKSTK